jgi:AcrR family transcriptional regulator
MPGSPRTLRARKKEQTRDALVETAYRLFLEYGYERTTVDRIAEASGISQRTFFRYFASKDEVVFARHAERIDHFRKLIHKYRLQMEPMQAVRATLEQFAAEFQARQQDLLRERHIIRASVHLTARDVEEDLEFEHAIAETLVGSKASAHEQLMARVQAGAIFGAVRATLSEWYSNDCRTNLSELAGQVFEILEQGIGLR